MPDSADAATALAGVPLFADLSKRHIGAIAKLMKKVEHRPGSEVAAQGRGALAFHVIADGDAAVRVGDKLRRTLHAGDYFGEISMIDGEPRSATVVAGSHGMTTYALNRTEFLRLVDNEKDFARAIMVALCGRIRASESSL
jgi:CRP/FNR family cyclic AMP-dependent transcriptional regulator